MKKVVFFLLVFFLTVSNVYALNKYKVTFIIDSYKNIVEVEENNTVTPPEPIKDGYTLVGFINDGVMFDFNTPITKNITLTAIWEKQNENNEDSNIDSSSIEQVSPYNDDLETENKSNYVGGYNALNEQAKYLIIGIPVILVILFKYMLIPILKAKKDNKENKN